MAKRSQKTGKSLPQRGKVMKSAKAAKAPAQKPQKPGKPVKDPLPGGDPFDL